MVAKDLSPAHQLSRSSRPRFLSHLCRSCPPNGHRSNAQIWGSLQAPSSKIEEGTNLVGNVHPRFIRERMPGEDDVVTTTSKVWALVHFQSDAVTQPMSEVLLPAVGLQHRSSGLVRGPRERPVFGSFKGGGLSISNSIPNLKLLVGEYCRR